MTKGREKSDGRTVPEGRRKATPTASERGGKATTATKQVPQLKMFSESADSPKGVVAGAVEGRPSSATSAMPLAETTKRHGAPTPSMEEIARLGNLLKAFENVASNRGAPGPDRQTIEQVGNHLSELLPKLQKELQAGTYQPGEIRRVWIPKPGGGQRGLGIPDVIDRVVQQAALQVLSPLFEPTFHDSSHGFRPGKSCHTAIAEAKSYMEEGYEYVVDIDLEKFFDRVNHQRLMARLEQKIDDRRILDLIRRMLRAKVVLPDGVVITTDEGTPQGGPLSPLLSNIVLDELDQELARRGHCFVRYADDCNIYVRSERAGLRVMEGISRFISRKLRLSVNQTKSAVARPETRHFLGFRLRSNPMDGSVDVLLSKRSKARLAQRLRDLIPRTWGQSLDDCIKRLNSYLRGWIGFFRICTEGESWTIHKIDAHVRRRLRALVLRQWKTSRTRVRRLIRLGVKPRTAMRAVYGSRKRLWDLSRTYAVQRALNNAWFAARDLFSVEESWEAWTRRIDAAPVQLTLWDRWGP